MHEAQRSIHAATPAWINVVFGLAVTRGVIGSLGLLMRRGWATPLLPGSLVAVIMQMVGLSGHAGMGRVRAAYGPSGLVMPVLRGLVAFGLWRYAVRAGTASVREGRDTPLPRDTHRPVGRPHGFSRGCRDGADPPVAASRPIGAAGR